jgi:SAM-dependent methyltransferase
MVHALKEARRVLKPGGLLVDLRPAAVHRRVGISYGGRWRQLGVMREPLDDDRAANRAVLRLLKEGLLKRESRTQFDGRRVMDTLEEFREFQESPSQDRLFERVASLLADKRRRVKIVVRGPLIMQVLRKTGE